jgi:hypothetical protein
MVKIVWLRRENKPQPGASEETGLLDSIMCPATFLESYPVQANLYLRHGANDDPDEASSNTNISFNLRLIAELYRIYKSDDKLSDSYFSK